MKKRLLFRALQNLKANPALMKKVKIFALVGFAGFLLTGGLVIWAAIAAFESLSQKAITVAQSSTISQSQALNCWNKAERIMGSQSWMQRPLAETWTDLKEACWNQSTLKNEGSFI